MVALRIAHQPVLGVRLFCTSFTDEASLYKTDSCGKWNDISGIKNLHGESG